MHRLTKAQARRIAVRAQLLDAPRPTDLLAVVQRLTLLQIDPTAAIAPSADLVAWSRLGSSYDPAHLRQALEHDRTLFEHNALVRPMSDLGLLLAGARTARSHERTHAWVKDNDCIPTRHLEAAPQGGAVGVSRHPGHLRRPWASTGWTNNRNVTQMLELLMMRGEVAIAARAGRERLWDLAERVYPAGVVVPPVDEAPRDQERAAARLARHCPAEEHRHAHRAGRRGRRGRAGRRRRHEGRMACRPGRARSGLRGRIALLSPFDRLVYDRARAKELFDFDYTLEMYKPAAKRRWGYFALPVLHDDRLVGKVDAVADRKASVLRVHAVHEDVKFTRAMTKGVQAELADLASWLGLGLGHVESA